MMFLWYNRFFTPYKIMFTVQQIHIEDSHYTSIQFTFHFLSFMSENIL